MTNKHKTVSTSAGCKVLIYNWDDEGSIPRSGETAKTGNGAERLDISSELLNVSFTKDMNSPAGTFSINLADSQDWKSVIRRGSWVIILMSQDRDDLDMSSSVQSLKSPLKQSERKFIRCIGYVDRVNTQAIVQDNGGLSYNFEVSGRDFGIVYEDTEVWHNMFRYETLQLTSFTESRILTIGNTPISKAMDIIHDLFYYPSNVVPRVEKDKSLLDIGLQWELPAQLCTDLGFKGTSGQQYWGALPIKNFSETKATIALGTPTDFLSGNAWSKLKELSCGEFHELYTEINEEGKPELIYRPIPWAMDDSKYKKISSTITKYKDLDRIIIPSEEVFSLNLGEDSHNRFNSFLVTVSSSLINQEDNISLINDSSLLLNDRNSIRRHGFKPMHVTIDAVVRTLTGGGADSELLQAYNELLRDMWQKAVFSESGSIEIIGNNKLKIGKVLGFDETVPYSNNRIYYIEGYSDSFSVEENGSTFWSQSVKLTRGFKIEDLDSFSKLSRRDTAFDDSGEFTGNGE